MSVPSSAADGPHFGTAMDAAALDLALLRGAVLLTPNARSARGRMAAFDAARRAEGARAWQPAQVMPWRGWINGLWHGAVVAGEDGRVLLNEAQELRLWDKVVREGADAPQSPAAVARMCRAALNLLGEYDVRGLFRRAGSGGADAAAFSRWYRRFVAVCEAEALLPASHAALEIATLLRDGRVPVAAEYLLYGFGALTPAQEMVLAALRDRGASVRHVSAAVTPSAAPALVHCDGPEDELERCAEWVRATLVASPGRTVAVVVPDLEACRPALERALRAAVAPDLADVTRPERNAPFEFSAGRPLHQLPMVADALRLLRWCVGEIPVEDAGAVLRSRFLALAPTPERGGELDAFHLRRTDRLAAAGSLRGTVSLETAAALLHTHDGETAWRLRGLAASAAAADRHPGTHAEMADAARELLERAGWPGAAELSGEEFQAVDRWNEALDRIASLDLFGERLRLPEFVELAVASARETMFAPENTGAPVQVISVAEAAGSTADALWFLHADAGTWPPRVSPNPLLPWTLQRELRMPGTDPADDEARARQTTDGLVRSAGAALFSYAASTADGSHQLPSPLIEALSGLTLLAEPVHDSTVEDFPELESAEETVPLPSLEGQVAEGGVSVLQAQAQCGFRAWAERRLFATEPETVDAGMSQADRGSQVHAVLERFWTEVKDQATLRSMMRDRDANGVSARDRLLGECIDAVLREAPAHAWDAAYVGIQRERLMSLLGSWLNAEAERPPFRVVGLEVTVPEATVGPLRLKNLRVDRIDHVTTDEGEGNVLIDYKTGRVQAADWKGERPNQPQLPVYAVAAGIEDVRGVGFALVRIQKDGMKVDGLADPQTMVGGRPRKMDFNSSMEAWATDLERLAEAFARGEAGVDPKEYPKTCDTCGQRMLCRLDPMARLLDDVDDEEDEEFAWS